MANSIMIASVAGIVTLVPSVALSEAAIPISECEFSQSYGATLYYEDHKDIGAGIIMYAERSEDSGLIYVADCFSGSTLLVEYSGRNSNDEQRYVLDADASPEKATLATIREHFSSLGTWTQLSVQDVEHCACAAFYPEAKGEKGYWKLRYGHP